MKKVNIVKLLLENETVDINILNDNCCFTNNWYLFKQTALFCAVELNNVEIVKLILNNRKPDVNVICTKEFLTSHGKLYEKTVIYEAVESRNN